MTPYPAMSSTDFISKLSKYRWMWLQKYIIIEIQNMLCWKGSTRIIKPSSWPCTGHPKNPTLGLRMFSKYFLKPGRLGAVPIPWGAHSVPHALAEKLFPYISINQKFYLSPSRKDNQCFRGGLGLPCPCTPGILGTLFANGNKQVMPPFFPSWIPRTLCCTWRKQWGK